MITRSQGEALVALLGQLRKDWDLPGIRTAVQKAGELGTATEIAVAACRIAGNHEAKTPGLIPMPGTHWQGTQVGAKPLPTMCPTHSLHRAGRCPQCEAETAAVDHAAHAAEVKAALKAAQDEARDRDAEQRARYAAARGES